MRTAFPDDDERSHGGRSGPRAPARAATLLMLLASAGGCAAGQQRSRHESDVAELRAEIAALQARSDALEAQAEAREAKLREDAQQREIALREEIEQLREQAQALQAAAERSPEGESGALADGGQNGNGGEAKANARARKNRRAKSRRSADPPDPPPDNGTAGEDVRTLMAEVAARLQAASESATGDRQAQARLSRARDRLMEADRAAAQKLWERAMELTMEAHGLLRPGSKSTSQERATAPEEALARDARELFGSAARATRAGLRVVTPLVKAKGPNLPPVDTGVLERLARLAKTYPGVRLQVQLQGVDHTKSDETSPAVRNSEAVRTYLATEYKLSLERVVPGTPLVVKSSKSGEKPAVVFTFVFPS